MREGEKGTYRETMAGAMRLVMRSVAVTLTLIILASSSGDVSTKSAGISWDTPTLLTVGATRKKCKEMSAKKKPPPFLSLKEKGGSTHRARRLRWV